jgi:hypothetical protein
MFHLRIKQRERGLVKSGDKDAKDDGKPVPKNQAMKTYNVLGGRGEYTHTHPLTSANRERERESQRSK